MRYLFIWLAIATVSLGDAAHADRLGKKATSVPGLKGMDITTVATSPTEPPVRPSRSPLAVLASTLGITRELAARLLAYPGDREEIVVGGTKRWVSVRAHAISELNRIKSVDEIRDALNALAKEPEGLSSPRWGSLLSELRGDAQGKPSAAAPEPLPEPKSPPPTRAENNSEARKILPASPREVETSPQEVPPKIEPPTDATLVPPAPPSPPAPAGSASRAATNADPRWLKPGAAALALGTIGVVAAVRYANARRIANANPTRVSVDCQNRLVLIHPPTAQARYDRSGASEGEPAKGPDSPGEPREIDRTFAGAPRPVRPAPRNLPAGGVRNRPAPRNRPTRYSGPAPAPVPETDYEVDFSFPSQSGEGRP